MKKLFLLITIGILLNGCISFEPTIESTKSWEQHYKSVEEFKAGTENIVLDEDETIWVMSNKTLNRLLLNLK